MFKSNTVHLVGLLVLSFGLASCGRDQKPAAASPNAASKVEARALEQLPRIRRGGISLDALAWDQESDQSLKLSDGFEIIAGPDLSLRFHVACEGDKNLIQSTEFKNESRIDVYRIVPKALLTSPLAEKPIRCQITFNVDRVGRPVRGHTLTARIIDGDTFPVAIISPDRKNGELVVGELYGVTGRFEHPNPTTATLLCADVESPPVPFNVVQDLSTFDLRLTKQSSETRAKILRAPVQSCRLIVSEKDARPAPNATDVAPVGISGTFPLHFKGEGWRVTKIELNSVSIVPTKGTVLPLGEWEITNVGSRTAYIRFPEKPFLNVEVGHVLMNGKLSFSSTKPWGRAVPIGDEIVADRLISMPVGRTIHVKHEIEFPSSPACANRGALVGTWEQLAFDTFADPDMNVGLGTVSLPWQRKVLATYDPTLRDAESLHGSAWQCLYE